MTVPEARRDPILARFELRRRKLPFAGRTVSMVVPASIGEALRERAGNDDPDEQPYWAELWPASVALARNLMRGPPLVGLRVLDVGCGLGLAGIAAGIKGASVVFADREPDALAFARFNATHNGVVSIATLGLDWNHALPDGPFDLILLADVTYSERNHAGLLRLIDHCLAPQGRALAADPFRAGGAAFADAAAQRFFCAQAQTDCFFADARLDVRIVTIARSIAALGAIRA